MTLGDILKQYRVDNNISMDEFVKRSSLSKGYISMLENNINPRNNKPIAPTLPTIRKVAIGMNMDIDSLLKMLDTNQKVSLQDDTKTSYNEIKLDSDEIEHIKKYRSLDPYGKETVSYILNREANRTASLQKQADHIKKLETQPATIIGIDDGSENRERLIEYFRSVSAGTGQVIFDDVYSERIQIPDIPKYRRVAYAVKVDGSSMEPLYSHGDILLIEPTCEINVNEIGIFNVSGQAYVKQLGDSKLISLNKGYKDIPLTEDSLCMGRVVDKLSDY